jgi:sodium transport system permease protein
MNIFLIVFKKEWLAELKDRRSLIITFVVFGLGFPLFMFLPYMLLAGSVAGQLSGSMDVAVSGLEHAPLLANFKSRDELIRLVAVEDAEAAVRAQEYQVGIVLPPDFESRLQDYQPVQVEVISRQGRVIDAQTSRVTRFLEQFSISIVRQRLQTQSLPDGFVKPFSVETRQIVTEGRFQRSYAGWIIVILLTFYGFSVGMSKAVSVSAGEKERLTMEVLLLAPANRAGIVMGKVLFIITYGIASLIVSAISFLIMAVVSVVVLAMNVNLDALTTAVGAGEAASVSSSQGGPAITVPGVLVFLLLILFCIVIFTVLQVMVGLWARNESQASNILAVVNLAPGLISIAFFSDSYSPPLWHYAIPILSQSLLIPDLLVNHWEVGPLLVSLISSVVAIILSIMAATWMMNHEEIIART